MVGVVGVVGWLGGWMVGWLDGWVVGWLGGDGEGHRGNRQRRGKILEKLVPDLLFCLLVL